MKKHYLLLALVGLILGYLSKYDFWFEDGRDVFFPITKEQLKRKKSETQNSSQSTAAVPANSATVKQNENSGPAADLENLSQYELFNELYNAKVLTQKNNQQVYFEKIKNRLSTKYPVTDVTEFKSRYEKEVTNRLGLLRAMSQFWPSPREVHYDHKAIKQFYFEVARNKDENIMVRRQAYKNWLTFGNTVSLNEKNQAFADADSRLLHLISLSDETLIQSLTESAE